MKRITISIRDYTFKSIFPLTKKTIIKINQSERIEELILKGLEKEKEDLNKRGNND